jgi:myosin heavy subunit
MPETEGVEDAHIISLFEELIDALERDLPVEQDKYEGACKELSRLKEHLVQMDSELTLEGQKKDQLVERFKERTLELQSEVAHWKEKYEESHRRPGEDPPTEDSDDEILARIEHVTKELVYAKESCEYEKHITVDLKRELHERDITVDDLRLALGQLEATVKREIDVGLAESQQRLAASQKTVDQLRATLEDAQAEIAMVPDLKRKIAELDVQLERAKLKDNKEQTSDTVEKALVANLFVNLFDRSRPVERRQVANMLCDLLRIDQDDRERIGLLNPDDQANSKNIFSFADQWIAYLSKETSPEE